VSILTGSFRRELGLFQLTMFGFGAILGAGWLFAPAKAAALAGPAEVFAWVIAGLMLMTLALVYAELGSSFPTAGGVAKYSDYSHGPLLGFITGWSIFLAGASYSSLEAVASAQALSFLFPSLARSGGSSLSPLGILFAFGLLALFFSLNMAGVRKVGGFLSGLTLLKMLVPITVLVFVLSAHPSTTAVFSGNFAPSGIAGVFMAVSAGGIISTYSGFRQPIDMAAEAKNPRRDIPRAVIYSTLISIVLYTMLGLAFLLTLNWGALGLPIGNWKALTLLRSSAFVDSAAAMGAVWLVAFMLLDSVYSPMGESGVYFTTSSRVSFAMAEQGYLPKALCDLNDNGVPTKALLLGLALSALFIIPFPSWYQMVEVASGLTVITYSMGPVSAAVLRRFGQEGFRVPLYKALGPVAFAVASLLIYWFGWPYTLYVVGMAMLGLPVYLYFRHEVNELMSAAKSAGWYVAYLALMLFISFAGSSQFGGMNYIRFPMDQFSVVIAAIALYWVGVKSAAPNLPSRFLTTSYRVASGTKRLIKVVVQHRRGRPKAEPGALA